MVEQEPLDKLLRDIKAQGSKTNLLLGWLLAVSIVGVLTLLRIIDSVH